MFRARVLLPFREAAFRAAVRDSIPPRAVFPALLVAPFAILLLRAVPRIFRGLLAMIAALTGHAPEPTTPRQFVVPMVEGDERATVMEVVHVAVESAPSLDTRIDSLLGTTRGFVIGFAFLCLAAGACARGARAREAIMLWFAASCAWTGAMYGWWLLWMRASSRFGPMDRPSPPIDFETARPSDLILRILTTNSFDSLLRLILAVALAILALRALQSERFRSRLVVQAGSPTRLA